MGKIVGLTFKNKKGSRKPDPSKSAENPKDEEKSKG